MVDFSSSSVSPNSTTKDMGKENAPNTISNRLFQESGIFLFGNLFPHVLYRLLSQRRSTPTSFILYLWRLDTNSPQKPSMERECDKFINGGSKGFPNKKSTQPKMNLILYGEYDTHRLKPPYKKIQTMCFSRGTLVPFNFLHFSESWKLKSFSIKFDFMLGVWYSQT